MLYFQWNFKLNPTFDNEYLPNVFNMIECLNHLKINSMFILLIQCLLIECLLIQCLLIQMVYVYIHHLKQIEIVERVC